MKKNKMTLSDRFIYMSGIEDWINIVIDSCKTIEQLGVCYKLIDLYVKKYKFLGGEHYEFRNQKSKLETNVYIKKVLLLTTPTIYD